MKIFALALLLLFIVAFSIITAALSGESDKDHSDKIEVVGTVFWILASIGSIPFYIWYLAYGI